MNKNKKSFLAFCLAVLFSFTLLTGCRTKGVEVPVKSYEGVELTYYKLFDDSEVVEPIIQKFENSHPGLKIHYKKFSDFDEYMNVVLNEMAEGEGPDILSMQNTWFASNFRKLTPLPVEFGKTSDFAATFVDVAYNDLVVVDETGVESVYGLPLSVDTLALYYNKDHFEDSLPQKGRPSSTWEGIKSDVIALTKADNSFDRFEVSGIALGRGENVSRAVDILYLFFLQYGTEIYNKNASEAVFAGQQNSGETSFPGLRALEFYASFSDPAQRHYSWNELTTDNKAGENEVGAFAEGRVSMIIGYSYMYDEIIDYINVSNSLGKSVINKDAVRVAAIPQLIDPQVSTEKRVTYANYFAEGVSRNSEYPDIAWDFLVELTTRENLEFYNSKTNKPTSRRDMIEDQKADPIYGVFASQVGFAESFPVVDYSKYRDIFLDLILRANIGDNSRNDLLLAQEKITELLPVGGIYLPTIDNGN